MNIQCAARDWHTLQQHMDSWKFQMQRQMDWKWYENKWDQTIKGQDSGYKNRYTWNKNKLMYLSSIVSPECNTLSTTFYKLQNAKKASQGIIFNSAICSTLCPQLLGCFSLYRTDLCSWHKVRGIKWVTDHHPAILPDALDCHDRMSRGNFVWKKPTVRLSNLWSQFLYLLQLLFL
jgi:hypothetical protein